MSLPASASRPPKYPPVAPAPTTRVRTDPSNSKITPPDPPSALMRRAPRRRSAQEFVGEAPAPFLAGFEGAHHRVAGPVVVGRHVAARGGVAAGHRAAV